MPSRGSESGPCGYDPLLTWCASKLVELGDYSLAEIASNIFPEVVKTVDQLPPLATSSGFAVIAPSCDALPFIAYWDANAGAWLVTTQANNYANPVLIPEWVVDLDNSIGTGSTAWQFGMGLEVRVTIPCQVSGFAIKCAALASQHSWEVLRSTTPGAAPPAFATYTDTLASGVHTTTTTDWEPVAAFTGLNLAPDDWVVGWYWVGAGGQFWNSTPAQKNETFGTINASVYASLPGVAPGVLTVPTTRSPTTYYGLSNLEFAPQ